MLSDAQKHNLENSLAMNKHDKIFEQNIIFSKLEQSVLTSELVIVTQSVSRSELILRCTISVTYSSLHNNFHI